MSMRGALSARRRLRGARGLPAPSAGRRGPVEIVWYVVPNVNTRAGGYMPVYRVNGGRERGDTYGRGYALVTAKRLARELAERRLGTTSGTGGSRYVRLIQAICAERVVRLEARLQDRASLAFRGAQERARAAEPLHEGLPAREVLGPAMDLIRVVLADLLDATPGEPGTRAMAA